MSANQEFDPALAGLTPRQRVFVLEYAQHSKTGRAARAAGYSDKTADSMGRENLLKPKIQKALQTLAMPKLGSKIASAEERQSLLTRIIKGELLPGEDDLKWSDRLKAVELLGKMRGDFVEKRQIDGDVRIRWADD